MDEKIIAFFETCSREDPSRWKQKDEVELLTSVKKLCADNVNGLTHSSTQRVKTLVDYFLIKDRFRAVVPLPELPVLPEELFKSKKTEDKEIIQKIADHYIDVERIIGPLVMGGLYSTKILEKAECADCDGWCKVQRAPFLDLLLEDEPAVLVPCISAATKELEEYAIKDFMMVQIAFVLKPSF